MGGESRSKCQEIRGGGVWCRYHISRIVRLVWPSGPLSLLTVLIPLFSTTAHSRSFLFATSFWTFNLTNTHSTGVKYTRSGRIVSTKECLGRVSFVMLLNLKPPPPPSSGHSPCTPCYVLPLERPCVNSLP